MRTIYSESPSLSFTATFVPICDRCGGCSFEDRFGGCVLLNCIGNDYPIEEFDEEWRNARKEGRRLKYCPLKKVEV